MAAGSQNTDPIETPDVAVEAEKASPTPQESLEDLRAKLETQKLSKEEREALLIESVKTLLTDEAKVTLGSLSESTEVTDENRSLLSKGTAYLLALAKYKEVSINSVQDLITEFRTSKDESLRFFAQTLIKIVAKSESPLSQEYQLNIWTEAQGEADALVAAMVAVEAMYKEKAEEEAEKKEEKEKGKDGKEETWYGKHKSEVNTALIVGGLGLGVWWLTKNFFKKTGTETSVSPAAKTALGVLVGAVGLGQVLGFESVQRLISGGKTDSWVYSPAVKGLVSAADLELGVAMDYWTGNGPSEGERTMFEQMAEIFDVADSRIWGTSKLGFDEFMDGKNGSLLPWYTDDEEKLRTSLKDYYLEDLEENLPYLKDPDKRKNVTLRQVLVDGFKLGIIKELDTTDVKEEDREALAERDAEDEKKQTEVRGYFDHPKENIDELVGTGESMIAQLDQLDQATDQYWNDMLVAFEDMIGVDFDLGEDDTGEYRDLKIARETLFATFEGMGEVDHKFFAEKKERVKAFVVFIKKHEKEDPWTAETQAEFDGYKTEILELNQRIQGSLRRAEVGNLKEMEKDRTAGEIVEDASEFAVVGLCGTMHAINYRIEQLNEGDKLVWALTIGQTIGVATEFAEIDLLRGKFEMKEVKGVSHAIYKVGKGATWNTFVKPAYVTVLKAVDGYKLFKAYRYSGEELLERVLKGEITEDQVRSRAELARKFEDHYKSRWLRIFDDNIAAAEGRLEKIDDVKDKLRHLKEMRDYVDGKITLDGVSNDETKALLQNMLPEEKLQEIRFYRAVNGMKSSPKFGELIEHLKDPTRPLSPEGKALFDTLNPAQQENVRSMVKTEKGAKILSEGVRVTVVEYIPEHLGVSESTGEKVHRYKFWTEEFSIKESEIATRAGEIAAEERAAGHGPVAGEEDAWNKLNWNKAVKSICETKFATPVKVSEGVWRYAGQEFRIDPTKIAEKVTGGMSEEMAARALCVEQGTAHLMIEEVEVKGGRYKYKIGGEWVALEDPSVPAKPDAVKAKFQETLAKEGKAIDFAKFAAEAKVLKYFTMLEKIMGTAGAVMVIYHLETAVDKRKAVCEVMAGFATFYAGMKAADWQVGAKIKNPGWRMAVDLAGGFMAAFGFTEPVSEIMTSYFETVPASHAVGKEVSDIFEKASYKLMTRQTLQSVEKGLIKKSVEKMGLRALSLAFEKKIGEVFLKRIGEMAARQGFKQVLKALGWKGITTAALLADDATVIGVVDDIVAVGLVIWMGFDLYQLVMLIANAVEIEKQMAERQKHEIESFDIKDPKSRAAFQEKLIPFGLTIERAHELPEETFFDILRTIPAVRVEFKRKDTLGSEIWTLNSGEAVGIAIYDEAGEVVCEITDEDAAEMEVALTEMESADAKELEEAA